MPSRVFLPVSSPLLPSVVNRILPPSGSGPLELGHLWIMVPTQQSGRRLREALAREWRTRGGTALLSLEVHPPAFLLQPRESDAVAHPFDWMEAWQEVLCDLQPDDLPALFPSREEPWTPDAARETGQRLQQVRNELLEGGLDFHRAASGISSPAERERWEELAQLEAAYRERLQTLGLADPVDAKAKALSSFIPGPEVRTLVMAGVPDPSPAVIARLKRLEQEQASPEIEVWIHTDERDAETFDAWGRPLDIWRTRELGRPQEPEEWIELLPDATSLCSRAADLLKDQPPLPDLALGLVDESLSTPLRDRLEGVDRKLYLPNPVSLADQEWVRILTALQEHRQHRDPESLRALMRFCTLYETPEGSSGQEILTAWDRYASSTFPESADMVDTTLKDPVLLPAWARVKRWLAARTPADILDRLHDQHQGLKLNSQVPSDRFRFRQLTAIADVLQEASRRQQAGHTPSMGVLLRVLREQSVDPLRVEDALTAEGWLELPYHPSPNLLLLGFQEGVVPPPLKPDPFLPNGMRQELGLKADRDWIARDAYLFHTLLCSRAPGHVRVLIAKRDVRGNPLLPSRFLFSCPREEMLKRAKALFREPPPADTQPAPAAGVKLEANRLSAELPTSLSVSAINHYLTCPTRFFFRHILGMSTLDDTVHYPDAAAFGEVIHRVLEQLVQSGCDTRKAWENGTEDLLTQEMRRRFAESDGLSATVFKRSARARLLAAGDLHVRLREEGWTTLALEKKVERECRGLMIHGVIDRIDVHPEHGILLLDAKTSDTAKTPAAVHLGPARAGRESLHVEVKGRLRQWANLQLPLYRWLAKEADPAIEDSTPLQVAYLNLPKAVTDTALEIWKEESDLIEEAERCLDAVVGHIQAGDWHPTTPQVNFDEFTPLLHHGSDWVTSGQP